VIEPLFERRFMFDSCACRQGKGTHAALNRFQHFCRSSRYVLQCDIRKFFPASAGTRFRGFRVFPTHRRLTRESIHRMRRRLRRMQRAFAFGLVDSNDIRARITAWLGHARHGQTWALCDRLLGEFTFSRPGRGLSSTVAVQPPSGSCDNATVASEPRIGQGEGLSGSSAPPCNNPPPGA